MPGEPSWFELGVADAAKARAFYGELFGWGFEPGPTGEQGGFVIRTSGLDGGVHPGDPGTTPYLFFRVEDMDAALERVKALGGTVETTPDQEAAHGRFAFCRDDQGSGFGLHQPPAGT